MVRKAYSAAIAMFVVALAGPTLAADKYVIDPEHVSVNFSMQHSKWAKYQGTVREIAGEIVFDKENVRASSVHVEMATKSIDTLDKARDAELQAPFGGFMNAGEYPKII